MSIFVCIFLAVLSIVFAVCGHHANERRGWHPDYGYYGSWFMVLSALSLLGAFIWFIRIVYDANH